ncbi:3-methyl-2-oxobutanoate hydroxymethyltransferase [Sodalis-like secondary symbiont of Drepanosiphum platanoidis]|uniref:3-methyl-2-oxobutanoate hydroxymethyltransferase n=1 Tax=Sodalis-like secondary symbiont of Drepanosiphum platanoidis TaxID=2994493 RepID=UPI003464B8BD
MITISDLIEWKNKKKFAVLTAYDSTFSKLFFQKGIKVMLVGDSLGMTIQGHNSTIPVTIKDMEYHTKCVRRGAPKCLLLSDLPFMSYFNKEQAYINASILMRAGANIIKLEGGKNISEIIYNLTIRSIPVCAHIGLTPQSINLLGKYKVQGRKKKEEEQILSDALSIESSGAKLLVLECVPINLAKKITNILKIPVIGIGSGSFTDGQILVMQDFLGISGKNTPSFSKSFLKKNYDISSAVTSYIKEVENCIFPSKKESFL